MTGRRQPFSGLARITGVGCSPFSRDSGTTVKALALTAARAALDEAGLAPSDIDGILIYHENDSIGSWELARSLGVGALRWHNDLLGGGTQSASILGDAAFAIEGGVASRILVVRALNGRSGPRMGQAPTLPVDNAQQFTMPFGLAGPPSRFALTCRLLLERAGLDEEDLAAVCVASRANARDNPQAVRREPITAADRHRSRPIATPLRLLDCCQETDGACALVIVDAAAHHGSGPLIHAVVRGAGPGAGSLDREADLGVVFSHYIAQELYAHAGMTAADVDLAVLYDAYSFLVLAQLADLGFCAPGEAGDVMRERALPVNTHGGLLSEGHIHGLNGVVEAVRQLRGDAGSRQRPGIEVALCTGFGGTVGSAALLVAA